jgi:hypothetical protein
MKKQMIKYWRLIFPITSMTGIAYTVIYSKGLGVDKVDILFASGIGIFVTVSLLIWALPTIEPK